ncbi:PQQ-dependent dehydrogenase, methanol/ethanol family [Devosia sp. A449]
MRRNSLLQSSLIALSMALAIGAPMAADTTAERLLAAGSEAEDANWLMVHRTYDSHRFSPLKEINTDTVKDLTLAFVTTFDNASRGGRYASARNEGTPLVEDGFMYVQSGWSVVYKVDVRDGKVGKIIWKYDPEVDREWISDATCCGAENRGIGLWNGDVIGLTMDGRVFSLSKESGEVNWEVQRADQERAESFTGAPLIVGDTAVYGPAGGEYGIRGWLEALDLNTGEPVWRTHLVPGPGEPGFDTWEGRDWETGGASIWQTGSYDPETGMMYWGTGNPAPQIDAEYRPGDNLYASSIVAISSKDGAIDWHYQFTPNDPYDYDEVGDNQLIDVVGEDGKTSKMVVRAARNGFMYGFDRLDGKLSYAEQYVEDVSWTTGIDLETGKPNEYDPAARLQKYIAGTVGSRAGDVGIYCPTLGGGKNWQPAAYNPGVNLLYVTSAEGCSAYVPEESPNPTITGGEYDVVAAQREWNGRLPAPEGTVMPEVFNGGSVIAIDPVTGETVSKVTMPRRLNGMLATGGDLVFGSGTDGYITAYDAKSLEVVWKFNVGTSLAGPPMSYAVDGKQYIAVLAGAAPSAADRGVYPPSAFFVPTDQLYVFAIN